MNGRARRAMRSGSTSALVLRGVVCAVLLFHLYCALSIAGVLPGYAADFYWFTLPHLFVIVVALAAVVLAAAVRKAEIHGASIVGLASLFPTFLFAIVQWPGGDDGPGMAWMFVVGGLSIVNTVTGIALLSIARNHEKSARP